ncbi:c-type cytochrome [Sphingobacterium faecale]|uniref:C-type cytochrome n=1 Tax=Sphingobacterium faecale TaxID=2803775 RepID=A0ABS1QXZ8_9SPHI|nr:cytochrome c [Sphingobacterium faecale]MBL1407288.1 c-type cytochrome [Sphingobacterium faecale]
MRLFHIFIILGITIFSLAYLASCHSNLNIETAQYAVNGQKLYTTNCQNCHGAKGEGLGKLYPPLTDAAFFKDNRAKLSCMVKNGMQGEIIIHGQVFNEKMPANPQLSELDIAYILTYITTNFTQSDSIYSHQEVKEALKNCN